MLPADLDDEQRAHLAHEHPNDLDSSPSSPSSSVPTFYDSRRRPKPVSRHRSHTATDGSSSSHLLARLVSREEEVREINAALAVSTERLEAESSRANAAERRALDYFHRLRIATENRERAEQESARLREELKLYKLQLDNAQKEIFRAQDIIDQVAAQRNEAEADAARARTKARKLQEEKLVMLAREEGRKMGYQEGLSMGRRIGYDQEHEDDDENDLELGDAPVDEERDDPRSHDQLRSSASIRQPMRSESAPPVRTFETPSPPPPLPIPSRVIPTRVHTPSYDHHTPSPPRELDEPETIHPIPIRPSPTMLTQPISVPLDDGWIPRADSRTSRIAMPSPHQLQQPVPPSPGPVAAELRDNRATPQLGPTPVPPPVRARDYAYQTGPLPHIPRGHAPSLASRASTHISQCDLVNKRPGSSLRNEIHVGRARSGSQASRESTSRNEHRDQERRYSSRTEAETIAERWRADSEDDGSPPQNPSRSFTPTPVPHPHRPPNFYYRPRDVVTPVPPEDVDDSRSRTPVPTEPNVTRPRPPPDDPEANTARVRTPLEYFRKRFRQRPSSGGSGSIPNIIVESPSEPETTMSPRAATTTQPELLSPEAANRPLPQDDVGQHQHQQHQQHHYQPHSQSYAPSQPPPQSHRHHHSSSYDTAPRSGTPYQSWPVGFIPYPPGHGTASSSSNSNSRSGPERDYRRGYPNPAPSPSPVPVPAPYSHSRSRSNSNSHGHAHSNRHPTPGPDLARSQHRPRTQSTSMPMGRAGSGRGAYEAAPLPPGVMYPAPPVRPHTSHRPYRDREGDSEREWDRDRQRAWDRDRDRERDERRRQDSMREYERDRDGEREQDPEDTGFDEELTRSPAPLQRPISLFDSDEA